MTRPHLITMETEGSKGDHRENYDSGKESARDVIAINLDVDGTVGEGDDGGRDDEGPKKSGKRRSAKSPRVQIPTLTVENPTPTPRLASGRKEKGKDVVEEDEDDDDDLDYDTGEEEEVEEEEVDTEMTPEEKQAMYESVKEGDIDALEDCLDLPNADINMTWFQENLLMTAIRAGHTEMAEFLVDNGVDHTHTTSRMAVRETSEGVKKFDRYEVDCRKMAFDYGLDDLVYLLDHLQGRLFSFVPAPKRSPRMRRPPPPPITPTDSNTDDEGNSSDADVSDSSSLHTPEERIGDENNDSDRKKRKKKSKRNKAENKTMASDKENGQSQGQEDEEVEEKDRTAWTGSTFTEVDSGNYSMASGSKLKKGMVEKHNKLLELDLEVKDTGDSKSSKTNSPRKSNVSGVGSEKSRGKKSQSGQEGGDGDQGDGEERTDTSRSKSLSTSVLSPDLGPPLPIVPFPPNDPIRFNRSHVSVQKSDTLRRFYTAPLHESNVDTPLAWKKICTTGSYVMESKNWHRDDSRNKSTNNTNNNKTATPVSKLDRGISNISSSASTGLEVKSNLSSKSPLSLRGVSATSSVPQRTNSSLLPPPASSTSSLSSLSSQPPPSPSSSRPRTISSRSTSSASASTPSILKTPHTSGDNTIATTTTNNKHIRFTPDPATKPNQPNIAGYMRPTQSTITKQRLYPRFVDSYGGLDFHHVAGRPQIFKLNLSADRPLDIKTSSSFSLASSNPNTKSNSQRRNHNAISYRS